MKTCLIISSKVRKVGERHSHLLQLHSGIVKKHAFDQEDSHRQASHHVGNSECFSHDHLKY